MRELGKQNEAKITYLKLYKIGSFEFESETGTNLKSSSQKCMFGHKSNSLLGFKMRRNPTEVGLVR